MSAETDATSIRPSKRARASSNTDNVSALQCQVCRRTYDRLDHLNRHLDSQTYFFDTNLLMQKMLQKGNQALIAPLRERPRHATPASSPR
ncbi:hypothetical protein COCC4DRAFT_66923 [Bipolaris maydis ATCC 48331]|uniref:C2H2-type domain-containing protein n=2 Tax=Cochliobolus heterostrophus TaxID=5016 RepID=M2SHX9_COCH5|nr:uncharacterized protein COCC4DRAFT_66923 [Bipolaris maydis ATCC 48331]EMD84990.1 hypothetical protein COCHEDRAFT_1120504 [Bipolaris maydis C5]ENH98950.1 hypothetical protein COCC4DRAFT_66923 [Bipolaris maydis ATCC 48331]KAJ6208648.1 hypothetical protein PSV09DRAFT_1120504 [Bipolaris maydis]